MKKIYFLITFLLIIFFEGNAQVNYNFAATTENYTPVSGGIVPTLTSSNPAWETADEGFVNGIPVGFTFNYNGIDYTTVNINVNGFITLGSPFEANPNYKYFENSLKYGAQLPSGNNARPVIAPLWDDLYLVNSDNLVYKTSGIAPQRVFTIEWKQARWTYEATAPVLSIELKLFETTNDIEFHYKDEGAVPYAPKAFASIGITSAFTNGSSFTNRKQ
jgi:hypothetical protein